MTRPRRLLVLAGLLLGSLGVPHAVSAQATDPTPSSVSAEHVHPREYLHPRATSVGGRTDFRVRSATDPSGIESAWLKVDGVTVAEAPQPCAADAFADCGDIAAPVVLSVDTRTLADGPHIFTVGVTDGDGYERTVLTRTLRVDNTAPGAPVPLTPQQINTPADEVTIRWTDPTEPKLGVSAATLCDAAGCRRLWYPMGAGGVTKLPVRIGVTTLTVWLTDEAGNSDPSRTTTWTINRIRGGARPRQDPGLRIASAAVCPDRRTVSVTGSLRVPHTNRVSVSVRARFGTRVRTVRTVAVTHGHDFRAHVVLPSARWRTATVIARVAGTSRYLTVEKRRTVRRPGQRSRKR